MITGTLQAQCPLRAAQVSPFWEWQHITGLLQDMTELLSPCQFQVLVPRLHHVASFLSGHLPGLSRELRQHPRATPLRDPRLSHLGSWDLGSEAPHGVTASFRWDEPFKVTYRTAKLAGQSQRTRHPPPCEEVTPQPHGLPSGMTPAPSPRGRAPQPCLTATLKPTLGQKTL